MCSLLSHEEKATSKCSVHDYLYELRKVYFVFIALLGTLEP